MQWLHCRIINYNDKLVTVVTKCFALPSKMTDDCLLLACLYDCQLEVLAKASLLGISGPLSDFSESNGWLLPCELPVVLVEL